MPLQITQPRQKQSFSQQLGNVANAYSQMSQEKEMARKEIAQQKAIAQQFPELAGMPPEMQKAAIPQLLKGRQGPTSLQQSQQQLNEARLSQIEEQKKMFNQLSGQAPQQNAGMGVDQPQKQQQGGIQSFPEEGLQQLASFKGQPGQQGVIGNMADAELNRRKEEKKLDREEFQSERGYHSSYSKKAEEVANALRTSLPKKEMALDFARNAVELGDVGYFSKDKLADATGIDLFRTAKGAQLVTAGKENLLSNISRVSAKAQNQWMEMRMNSMFPKIGQSKEANLTVQEMLEGEAQLDRAYLNEFDRLSAEDESKYKFVRKDIEKRARDAVKPIEKEIMRRTSYRMKEIEEQESGLSSLKEKVGKNVTKGTPLTMAMAKLYKDKFKENALNVAEKNGYYIPTIEEFQMIRAQPSEFRESIAP